MPLVAGNPSSRSRESGFSSARGSGRHIAPVCGVFHRKPDDDAGPRPIAEGNGTRTWEDQGARFVSSITLAAKTATAWGIYSDMDAYTSGPETNLAPQGNVLVCDSATQSGTPILYVFVYDPVSRTLKRFENNMNTERMTLKNVSANGRAHIQSELGTCSGPLANTCPEPTANVFSVRNSHPDEIENQNITDE